MIGQIGVQCLGGCVQVSRIDVMPHLHWQRSSNTDALASVCRGIITTNPNVRYKSQYSLVREARRIT